MATQDKVRVETETDKGPAAVMAAAVKAREAAAMDRAAVLTAAAVPVAMGAATAAKVDKAAKVVTVVAEAAVQAVPINARSLVER